MPKYPDFADRCANETGSVFEKFRSKMQLQGDRMIGLHIGDSYAAPPYDLPLDKGFIRDHPGFNRYCDTFGVRELREAIAEKLKKEKLVLDWRNRQQTRAAVRQCVETELDKLPDVYSPDIFDAKCNLTYQHVYEHYFGPGQSVYAMEAA